MGIAAIVHRAASERYRWIAYVGLAIILYVALKMIWDGALGNARSGGVLGARSGGVCCRASGPTSSAELWGGEAVISGGDD